ncbi:hypothetical protein M2444_005619 [Paenibacillus sp. PastF-3]|uniref:hypothetical protein n=1 Tax=Paenibacillus sp. PastF-3 TaxID=2940626 RepID=UPI00247586EA|nr:hypothetical protein [Paenibacillus sp. PastF-3]MDH6373776.1 hypothetical protein [Paenibacillus sp. PastF-3]
MNLSLEIEDKGNVQLVKISDFSLPYVEDYQDGIKIGEGYHTFETIAKALTHSAKVGGLATPILPRGTLYYSVNNDNSKCTCFLEVAPHRRSVFLYREEIEEVPFPRLIFGFELLHREDEYVISKVFLGATESYGLLNEDSEIYQFPYSNVDNFVVCWGSTERPILKRLSQLSTIPELFFNSSNTECYYYNANNSNLSYKELLEKLKGKDFPEEYLKNSGKTLLNWVNEFS